MKFYVNVIKHETIYFVARSQTNDSSNFESKFYFEIFETLRSFLVST